MKNIVIFHNGDSFEWKIFLWNETGELVLSLRPVEIPFDIGVPQIPRLCLLSPVLPSERNEYFLNVWASSRVVSRTFFALTLSLSFDVSRNDILEDLSRVSLVGVDSSRDSFVDSSRGWLVDQLVSSSTRACVCSMISATDVLSSVDISIIPVSNLGLSSFNATTAFVKRSDASESDRVLLTIWWQQYTRLPATESDVRSLSAPTVFCKEHTQKYYYSRCYRS